MGGPLLKARRLAEESRSEFVRSLRRGEEEAGGRSGVRSEEVSCGGIVSEENQTEAEKNYFRLIHLFVRLLPKDIIEVSAVVFIPMETEVEVKPQTEKLPTYSACSEFQPRRVSFSAKLWIGKFLLTKECTTFLKEGHIKLLRT